MQGRGLNPPLRPLIGLLIHELSKGAVQGEEYGNGYKADYNGQEAYHGRFYIGEDHLDSLGYLTVVVLTHLFQTLVHFSTYLTDLYHTHYHRWKLFALFKRF